MKMDFIEKFNKLNSVEKENVRDVTKKIDSGEYSYSDLISSQAHPLAFEYWEFTIRIEAQRKRLEDAVKAQKRIRELREKISTVKLPQYVTLDDVASNIGLSNEEQAWLINDWNNASQKYWQEASPIELSRFNQFLES